MIIVSDTSPISNLIQIGRENLLPSLFEKVIIPQAVWAELGRFHQDLTFFKNSHWCLIAEVSDRDSLFILRKQLDQGESEAIVLAKELGVQTVLIDEKPGRDLAKVYGLTPTGLLGVLLKAKAEELIPEIKPEMVKLRREANFFISQTLFDELLKQAGES